ncbi:MAG: ATP-binding protein [Rhodobacterales bacterium]|nr:ATP-binding protein [Rhodobacterales bacterium]
MQPATDPFAQADTHDLVIRAEPASVRAALLRVTASAPVVDLTADLRATVELVLAEVLNNVAEHAYAGVAGHVGVTVALHPGALWCEVVDEGAAMPGGVLPEGNLPEGDLPEGGFGWHLIRSMTQDIQYRRQRGTNRLNFIIPLVEGTDR